VEISGAALLCTGPEPRDWRGAPQWGRMRKSGHRIGRQAARPAVLFLPLEGLPARDTRPGKRAPGHPAGMPTTAEALTAFAAGLNRLERARRGTGRAAEILGPDERAAWEHAEALLDELHAEEQRDGLEIRGRRFRLAALGRAFTVLAREARLCMELRPLGAPPMLQPVVVPLGRAAEVLALLWCAVVPDRAWARLRRCQRARCDAWFADHSDNQARRYCSPACGDRAWSRARRRAAGHRSQAPKVPISPTRARILTLLHAPEPVLTPP
jgi:hypothetical protein